MVSSFLQLNESKSDFWPCSQKPKEIGPFLRALSSLEIHIDSLDGFKSMLENSPLLCLWHTIAFVQ